MQQSRREDIPQWVEIAESGIVDFSGTFQEQCCAWQLVEVCTCQARELSLAISNDHQFKPQSAERPKHVVGQSTMTKMVKFVFLSEKGTNQSLP